MQKKKILDMELPGLPAKLKGIEKCILIVEQVEISGRKHILADLYKGFKAFRYAVNEDEASRYSYNMERWSTAESQNIDIYGFVGYWVSDSEGSLTPVVYSKDIKKVCDFLQCKKKDVFGTIQRRISSIKRNREERRAVNSRNKLEEDMQLLQPLGMDEEIKEEWNDIAINRIAYRVKNSNAHFICLQCGEEYDKKIRPSYSESMYPRTGIERPSKGAEEVCEKCGRKAILFAQGRYVGTHSTRWYYFWQRIPDGIVCRIVYTTRTNRLFRPMDIKVTECVREFFRLGDYKIYGSNWNGESWYRVNSDYGWAPSVGKVYGDPLELGADTLFRYITLDEILRKTGLSTTSVRRSTEVMRYRLMLMCKHPEVEYYIKIGMTNIANGLMDGYGMGLKPRARKLADKLQIYPERVKEFKASDGTAEMLRIFQWERKMGIHIKPEDLEIYNEMNRFWKGMKLLEDMLKYMSITHLRNQVAKYRTQDNWSIYSIVSEYLDYLLLREKLGYDLKNSVYLNPRNLREAHTLMVKEDEGRKNNQRLQEVHERFPHISDRFEALNKKYHFASYGYLIRPARTAEEIVEEGWCLHHCVGGDNYLSKHDTGQTSILMMRSEKTLDIPYVTIEIDNKGSVLQWYGAHDKKDVTPEALCCISEFIEKMKPEKKKRSV